MMKRELRIVFMGTPDFAVASLQRIVEKGFNVVGVITAPDKPAGRGRKLKESAVKQYASSQGLNVLQPKNLKSKKFITQLEALEANLQVVVAFRMLPEVVFEMPAYGCFNLHASLLPQYRGAAPINWVLINGETQTGATTFFLKKKIDTGDIILQRKLDVLDSDTAGSLHDKLMDTGADLVLETCRLIEKDKVVLTPQVTHGLELKTAPKIFREDCEIDWNQPNKKVYDFIRGLSPFPTAWTTLGDKNFKIFSIKMLEQTEGIKPGEMLSDGKSYLRVATSDGLIDCLEVQLQGKNRLKISEFLRGYQIINSPIIFNG